MTTNHILNCIAVSLHHYTGWLLSCYFAMTLKPAEDSLNQFFHDRGNLRVWRPGPGWWLGMSGHSGMNDINSAWCEVARV